MASHSDAQSLTRFAGRRSAPRAASAAQNPGRLGKAFRASLENSTSQIGSGALPTEELPTWSFASSTRSWRPTPSRSAFALAATDHRGESTTTVFCRFENHFAILKTPSRLSLTGGLTIESSPQQGDESI